MPDHYFRWSFSLEPFERITLGDGETQKELPHSGLENPLRFGGETPITTNFDYLLQGTYTFNASEFLTLSTMFALATPVDVLACAAKAHLVQDGGDPNVLLEASLDGGVTSHLQIDQLNEGIPMFFSAGNNTDNIAFKGSVGLVVKFYFQRPEPV